MAEAALAAKKPEKIGGLGEVRGTGEPAPVARDAEKEREMRKPVPAAALFSRKSG